MYATIIIHTSEYITAILIYSDIKTSNSYIITIFHICVPINHIIIIDTDMLLQYQ